MCCQVVNCQYEEMSENVFQVKYEKSARHKGMLAVWSVTAVSLVVCMKLVNSSQPAVWSVTAGSLVLMQLMCVCRENCVQEAGETDCHCDADSDCRCRRTVRD